MKITEVELITNGPDLRPIINGKHYNETMAELGLIRYKPYSKFDDQFRKYLNVNTEPFTIKLYLEKSGVVYIKIDKGFTYDFASIPAFLRSALPSNAKGMIVASLVHDALFSEPDRPFSLETANSFFYQLMRKFGVSWWRAKLCYLGVCTNIAKRNWEKNLANYDIYPSFAHVLWLDK